MKATELILKLEALIAVHGDLPVMCEDGIAPSTPDHITDVEFHPIEPAFVWRWSNLGARFEVSSR